MAKPSRPVTRTSCVTCQQKFKPGRADQRYCSNACRARAHRARARLDDLDREIKEARRHYWGLIRRKAEALGTSESGVLTAEAQFVDEDGNVYMGGANGDPLSGGTLVGHTEPHRLGWQTWGLEAAGPPWSPPPEGD